MTDIKPALVSEDSLMNQKSETLGFDFDTNNERNAVSAMHIKNLTVDQLGAGTINVQINIGGPNIYIDGANNRIIINDGTVDRILIGYLSGGF